MKSIVYHKFGGPQVMALADIPAPKPGAGQALVRVKAASVNPVDLKLRAGLARFVPGSHLPRQMGIDLAGVVEETGPDVTDLEVGDEVFGWADYVTTGSFAEKVVVDTDLLVHKPANISFEGAACLPIAGSTVLKAFYEKGDLTADKDVLINGCMGGVGHIAVQIAKGEGAWVTGFCGEYDRFAAQRLGVDEVHDYRSKHPRELEDTFDLVLDTPGTLSFIACLKIMNPKGLFVHLIPTAQLLIAYLTSLVVSQSYSVFNTLGDRRRLLRLAELAEKGVLDPVIGKSIPLDEAVQGITDLENGERVRGKSVIVMP